MSLSVNIEKKFGNFHLRVKFEAENEILSILGASGCGKSMTLKCIAGIEKPDKGKIELDGITLFDSEKKINLSPQKRKVGYLFQQYALFPNMTVEQNIGCGVRDNKMADKVVPEMIHAMNLEGMEKKKPHQLSGGQQQRAALARILVNEPEVLLLDEPFSALDSHLRFQLEREVHEAMRKFGKPVILVSHDRDEVFRLSDSIAIMKDGRIEATGNKREVFHNPKTKSGAMLTGCKNISQAQMVDTEHLYAKDWDLTLQVPNVNSKVKYVGIRMHDVMVQSDETMQESKALYGKCDNENIVRCKVAEEIENPFSYTIMVYPAGKNAIAKIGVQVTKDIWEQIRDEYITIGLPKDAILLLEE